MSRLLREYFWQLELMNISRCLRREHCETRSEDIAEQLDRLWWELNDEEQEVFQSLGPRSVRHGSEHEVDSESRSRSSAGSVDQALIAEEFAAFPRIVGFADAVAPCRVILRLPVIERTTGRYFIGDLVSVVPSETDWNRDQMGILANRGQISFLDKPWPEPYVEGGVVLVMASDFPETRSRDLLSWDQSLSAYVTYGPKLDVIEYLGIIGGELLDAAERCLPSDPERTIELVQNARDTAPPLENSYLRSCMLVLQYAAYRRLGRDTTLLMDEADRLFGGESQPRIQAAAEHLLTSFQRPRWGGDDFSFIDSKKRKDAREAHAWKHQQVGASAPGMASTHPGQWYS